MFAMESWRDEDAFSEDCVGEIVTGHVFFFFQPDPFILLKSVR